MEKCSNQAEVDFLKCINYIFLIIQLLFPLSPLLDCVSFWNALIYPYLNGYVGKIVHLVQLFIHSTVLTRSIITPRA